MKAVQKQGTGIARLVDIEIPEPGRSELLLKPMYSGICATDLHVLYHDLGQVKGKEFPVVLGHEFSARVVKIGADVQYYPGTTREIKVNDRVTAEPFIPCRTCSLCLQGKINLCPGFSHLGVFQSGCFAEYVSVPHQQVHMLPEFISDRAGALVEPLSCAVNFVDKSRIRPGQSVVILGGGSIGQMTMQVMRAAGAGTIIVSDPVAKKRELALRTGAHVVIDPSHDDVLESVMNLTAGIGADVVVECAGLAATVSQMLKLVKRGGRCVMAGFPSQDIPLDFNPLLFGEIELVGAVATAWQFPRAMRLIELGLVDVEAVLDYELPFTEAVDGLAKAFNSNQIGKLVIKHDE